MRYRFFYSPDDPSGAPPATPAPATPAAPSAPVQPAAEPSEPAYYSQLSPELRDRIKGRADWGEIREKVPKLNHLAEAYLDSKDRLARSIVIPDPEKSTPEERSAFLARMGIPEKPDGYTFKTDDFKDVNGIDKLAEDFKMRAAAMGLTKKQAEAQFAYVASLAKTGNDAAAKARADVKTSFTARLKEAVGGDDKAVEEITNRMKKLLSTDIGDADLVQELAANGALYSPRFAQALAKLSKRLDDAPYIAGGQGKSDPKGQGAFGQNYSPEFAARAGGTK